MLNVDRKPGVKLVTDPVSPVGPKLLSDFERLLRGEAVPAPVVTEPDSFDAGAEGL